ncbi:MAG: hypothetical protein IPJ30_24630 [Acidobacteria bacterium]|nr:hypothetical protein [Acidobacteriota bacterium]
MNNINAIYPFSETRIRPAILDQSPCVRAFLFLLGALKVDFGLWELLWDVWERFWEGAKQGRWQEKDLKEIEPGLEETILG